MTRRLIEEESGVALVIAIVTMLVLGSLTSALLFSVSLNHQSSAQVSNAERAFGLAEEAIAYAEGRLYAAPVTGLTNPSTLPGTGSPFDSHEGWTYSGTFDSSSNTWTLQGNGTYNSVGRTVVVQVPINVLSNTVVHDDTATYQYMFEASTDCSTPASFQGNGAVTVPLYSNGCVLLQDHTQFQGNDLEVGSNLVFGPNAGVGQSSQKIGTLNVGGSCTGRISSCGNGNTNPVYANAVGTTLSPPLGTLFLPTITLKEQNPGCGAGSSGVPANFFDTDSTINNPTRLVNLFPATAYDCKIDADDEITWDGVRNLTVRGGPFYFDGSLAMAGTTQVIYTGSAAIFFSGTINLSGQAWLCGVTGVTVTTKKNQPTTYSCNTQWDPAGTRATGTSRGTWSSTTTYATGDVVTGSDNKRYTAAAGSTNVDPVHNHGGAGPWVDDTNQIVFVAGCWANSSGSSYVTNASGGGYCVDLQGQNTFQVGSVVQTDYHAGGNATNYGPVVANTLTVAGNPGQLIPFSTLPAGTPTTNSTATTSVTGGKPYNWNG